MALLLQKRGKLAEAEPLFREALEQYRLNAGDTHNATLHTIYNLAHLLQACGPQRLEEAEALLRETLGVLREKLGALRLIDDDAHANTLTCIKSLGILLFRLGKYAEAERLLCEAYEGWRQVSGDAHPCTREALFILTDMRRLLRRYKK